MKAFRTFSLVGLLCVAVAAPAAAQRMHKANYSDAYCSGFIAAKRVSKDLRIVMAEDSPSLIMYSSNALVYIGQGANSGLAEGQRYQIVRSVKHPDPVQAYSGQSAAMMPEWSTSVGHFYQDVGQVEIEKVYPTKAVARITFACDGVSRGDILIPFENRSLPDYKATAVVERFTPPSGLAAGTIIAMKDFAYMAGHSNAIYINLGSQEGLQAGDYLLLYRDGTGSRFRGSKNAQRGFIRSSNGMGADGKIPKYPSDLPREIIGEAFVVRAEEAASTAVVTAVLREIHAGDFVELRPFPEPEIHLSVFPESIDEGGTATLSWSTKFSDSIELRPAPGTVEGKGTMNVNPTATTTYTVVAQGRGGASEATVTLEVIPPPPPPPMVTPVEPTIPPEITAAMEERFAASVRDVFFNFDQSQITEETSTSLQAVNDFLTEFPQARLLIEGHTDEVGSDDYNLALGQRRANSVMDYLVALGANPDQIEAVSLGESRLFCAESDSDACRQLNRRVHFTLQQIFE